MKGRHAATRRRGTPVLLTLATVVGVWLGVSAPDVSPVAAPSPAQIQPAGTAAPAAPAPDPVPVADPVAGPRGQRGGGR